MSEQRPFVDPSPERWRQFFDDIALYRDDDDPAFWPAERLRDRRNELLRRQLGWLSAGSAFYKKRFDEAGVDPASVLTTEDLTRLPGGRRLAT